MTQESDVKDISGIPRIKLYLVKNRGTLITALIMVSVLMLMVVSIYFVGYHVPRAGATATTVGGGESVKSFEHDVDGTDSTNKYDPHAKVFQAAAIATDAALCSTIGKSILLKGGNAVDASIASLLCTGMTTAQSMGIGGGLFMTIYNRTSGKATTINARETAPGLATNDMFVNTTSASFMGGLSIAVPGEIAGYWSAHCQYGNLAWKELFVPAIKMAADGFPVPESFAKALQDSKRSLLADVEFRKTYVNSETGELYKAGEIMKMPRLAKTLTAIAEQGGHTFYNGSLAKDILDDLREIGSIITQEDLEGYTMVEEKPIDVTLEDGTRLLSLSIPSSGPLVAFVMNILDGYNMTKESIATPSNRILTYHRIMEAFKFSFAMRSRLGDTKDPEVLQLAKNLTLRSFADEIRENYIDDDTAHDYLYYGGAYLDHYAPGTSHVSVVDSMGNAVSVTSTVNLRFGSVKMGRRTGIIFNDEMNDFSTPGLPNQWGIFPSPANFVTPGSRPFSSMSPVVLVSPSGDVVGVYGAAGGSRISTAAIWVMVHTMWLGDSLQQAMDRPRLHHQLLPHQISYEDILHDQTLLDGLAAKGHDLHKSGLYTSAAAITITTKSEVLIGQEGHRIYAVSDMRKGGTPDGF